MPATSSYTASVVVGKSTYVFFNDIDTKTKKPTIQFFRVEGSDSTRDTIRVNKVAVESESGPIAAAVCLDSNEDHNIRVYYILDRKIVEVGLDNATKNKAWHTSGLKANGIEVAPGSLIAAIGHSGLNELREAADEPRDKDALLRIYYNSKSQYDMVTANTFNRSTGEWEAEELEA